MYLVDTNIWLEILLDQDRSHEAYEFLNNTDPSFLQITDFAVFSVGIILTQLERTNIFNDFIEDVLIQSKLNIIRLLPEDMETVNEIINSYNLDFDDAYHYASAEKFDIEIVSFDSDFNKTPRGRCTPGEILNRRKEQLSS